VGGFVLSAAEAAAALASECAADGVAGNAADTAADDTAADDTAADDTAADDTPVVVAGNGGIEDGTNSVGAGVAGRATEGRGNDAAEGPV